MNIYYKDEDCWLGWSEEQGILFLHTEVFSWSLSKYKKYLAIFAQLINNFPNRTLYSVATTKKALKFNELFGLVIDHVTEDNKYIMKIEV
jgi:hypothetical protein